MSKEEYLALTALLRAMGVSEEDLTAELADSFVHVVRTIVRHHEHGTLEKRMHDRDSFVPYPQNGIVVWKIDE